MSDSMIKKLAIRLVIVSQLLVWAMVPVTVSAASAPEAQAVEPEKGPHNGKLLRDGSFVLELALFERGVPPEYRVWITDDGEPVPPDAVDLNIQLMRLGGVVDDINFTVEGDYLRGDTVIYEPHSFVVTISARYQGEDHRWQYENFEGRTQIEDKVAQAMGIRTSTVGGATLHQSITAYGKLTLTPDGRRDIRARFDGEIKAIYVSLGDRVEKGQRLATIESNESLQRYDVKAPIDGVVSMRDLSEGEQTQGRRLMELVEPRALQAELAVYPKDWTRVSTGAPVELRLNGLGQTLHGRIAGFYPQVREDQARIFRVDFDDGEAALSEGLFVSAQIEVATIDVPLAVKRDALQTFRDFTVVYAKVGETYEVRMLDLGREGRVWVEVLGGIEPGTEYVTDNSYIIKADIEKSGASHDH